MSRGVAKKTLPKFSKRPKGMRGSNKVANLGLMQRNVSGPRFMKVRYGVNFTGTISVDGIDLIGACGAISISSTVAATLFTRAKIHYVTLIGTPPQPGQINEAKMEFGSGALSTTSSRDIICNSSNNPNVGPKLFGRPRKGTPASDFFSPTTTNILSLRAPINSILEIGLSVVDYEPGATASTYSGTFGSAGIYHKKSPDTNLALIT